MSSSVTTLSLMTFVKPCGFVVLSRYFLCLFWILKIRVGELVANLPGLFISMGYLTPSVNQSKAGVYQRGSSYYGRSQGEIFPKAAAHKGLQNQLSNFHLCSLLTGISVHCNKGRFCNNCKIDMLISKRLHVENKAKLSQLEIINKQYQTGSISLKWFLK